MFATEIETEPLPCQTCHWRSILAQIGWFDASLLFVAPLNDVQSHLLNRAVEKYDLTGAELFEAVLRDVLKVTPSDPQE